MNVLRSISPLDLSKTRVLIVEDNALDAAQAERAMQRHGLYDCHRATSAEDGLDQLTKRDFEVVIVDDSLPRTTGLEFLTAAKKVRPDIKYIIVAAAKNERAAANFMAAGAADYVSKDDFLTSGLIEAVQGSIVSGEEQEHPAAEANIWGASAVPAHVRAELDWLRSGQKRAQPPMTPLWDLDDDAVVVCCEYFARLLEDYPSRADEEEDALVEMLVERGANPDDILLLLDRAFMQVLLQNLREGRSAIPVRPSLAIARVLARVVDEYQQMLALQTFEVATRKSA